MTDERVQFGQGAGVVPLLPAGGFDKLNCLLIITSPLVTAADSQQDIRIVQLIAVVKGQVVLQSASENIVLKGEKATLGYRLHPLYKAIEHFPLVKVVFPTLISAGSARYTFLTFQPKIGTF